MVNYREEKNPKKKEKFGIVADRGRAAAALYASPVSFVKPYHLVYTNNRDHTYNSSQIPTHHFTLLWPTGQAF
jgi:hypothetical protein